MNELSELEQMQKIIEEYKNSTDMKLVEFAEKFLDGKNKEDGKSRYVLGCVNQRQVADIRRLTGLDVSEYNHCISANSIRHIEKRHGEKGQHDSSMQDIKDIARVKYVLDNYDTVELSKDVSYDIMDRYGNPAKKLLYRKRINGTYCMAEAVADIKNQNISIVTVFIQKAQKKEIQCVLDTKPQANVRNAHTHSLVNSIPQKQKHVKRKNKNDDREL